MNQTILLPLVIAFIVAVFLGPIVIPFLKRLRFGQSIRSDGPQSHHKKSGTPTMGGMIFLGATLVTLIISLVFIDDFTINPTLIMLMVSLFGFGLIGFIDDFLIVVKKSNEGLRPRQKIFGQFILAATFFTLFLLAGYSTEVSLFGLVYVDLAWGFGIFALFWMIGFSNATNLTDGLDGLLAGVSLFVFSFFAFVAHLEGNVTVMVFCFALVGALAGFLVFNLNPAKVFMGDTGSLALGASLAAISILLEVEFLLLIVGFIYVIETLSVIMQVLYFKATGGKRLFKMAPIHHHFELSGWSERKVVTVFWIVTAIMCAIALYVFIL